MEKINKKLTLGQRLKLARKEAGFSQKDLANKLQITDKAVSTYEVGRAHPSFEMMKKISQLTNKSISYFDENIDITEPNLEEKLDKIEAELREIRILLRDQSKKR